MKRIFFVVEGETEERFVRDVLYEAFILKGIHVEAQQWLTNRKLGTAGGGSNFEKIENHINRLLSRYEKDSDVFVTTMVDLFRFPLQGKSIYKPEEMACLNDGLAKALHLERAFEERIAATNFISYVQLHEFETLLLTKPEALSHFYTDKEKEIERIVAEIKGLEAEEINSTPENAPSKRIIRHLPIYAKEKTTAGTITAKQIGLAHLRACCPHFNSWISVLLSL